MSAFDDRHEQDGCGANAAPYVLGALNESECEAFRAHIATCAVCREEVAALQLVADVLPAAAPQLHAPSELKRRVMAEVVSDAGWQPGRVPGRAQQRERVFVLGRATALGLGAMVAALAIAAIALLGRGPASNVRVIRAQVLAPHASASLRLRGAHAELTVKGMPQAAVGRVYEVWVKRSGAAQPTDALFNVTAAGSATVTVPGNVAGVKQIMVTSEPSGGSRSPTRPPVIVASLS
jgi:anti-sigma-K factor RskA